jgi:polysaccharide export outer membrane protein
MHFEMSLLNQEIRLCVRWLSLILGTLCSVGCHSGAMYYASSLPPEFMAPRFASLNGVDLSLLSHGLPDSELLYPGDLIAVTVSTGLETIEPVKWKGRLAEDGSATIPLVGPVRLAGLTLTDAEQIVRNESIQRGKFVNPNVTVQIETRRSYTVTVVGAVEKPGTFQIPATGCNVLAAISRAEGLTKEADTVIEIRHPANAGLSISDANSPGMTASLAAFRRGQGGGQQGPIGLPARTVRIDLQQATANGNADVHLEDGSTVMVMARPKRYIHVMGLVRKPDQFEMPQDHELRLLDAISLANGRTLEVADKVRIIRSIPDVPEPIVIEGSIGEAKRNTVSNIRLAPGDVVSVEETPVTFVVGTIRDFVRFGFTAGIPGL